jgi:hypothetical protein
MKLPRVNGPLLTPRLELIGRLAVACNNRSIHTFELDSVATR